MKISLCIPTYTMNKELEELAIRAALTYRKQVDELIICEDGGMISADLIELCDKYYYTKKNGGFTKNVNRCFQVAEGDYIMIASSDTELMQGKLDDLCISGKVTSPLIANQGIERLAGPFFVVPKEILKERGQLHEEMHTYSSDVEYDKRVADIFEKVESVKIFHHQAQTVKAAGVEGGAQQQKDREAYQVLIDNGEAR